MRNHAGVYNDTGNLSFLQYYDVSFNDTSFTKQGHAFELKHPSIGILLSVFSFITIVGNILVIVAVTREIYLRTVTNYFIVSLAVADLMVGGIVMPFSISLEMTNNVWLYGPIWCDLWHSFDVLASTASIMNLCVISLDRYWAINDPISYPVRMSTSKVSLLIAGVWLCSATISFPAIAWWRAVTPRDLTKYQCVFTEDTGYLIFSSCVSFYCPLIIMLFVYYKIYKAAVAQTRSIKMGCKVMMSSSIDGETMTLRMHRGGRKRTTHENDTGGDRNASDSDSSSPAHLVRTQAGERPTKFITKRLRHFAISKKLSKIAKEQKAAKTLGIVVGVFILCWLPFFITNLLLALCKTCVVHPEILFPIFTWFGYINSGMNPIIYALSMRDFRRAFSKIIFICCPKYGVIRRQTANDNNTSTSFTVSTVDRNVPYKL
ncbi:dopamine receptor 2-like [Argonauta hians]